ncbi:unnamed protein product [Polarella glacialis]|uniref:Uncharacterized protein n=1 Tax=Polarella glacialis TaxID=89957 RepID=A0A813F458_POLGL|nr:unnamed protein product [Polarella glacialis]
MVAGSKKRTRDLPPAVQEATESSGSIELAKKKWVERPMEPVMANGRGMRVLGFIPLGGLVTRPLHQAPAALAAEAPVPEAAPKDPGAPRGLGTVEGPSLWKKGRPVYEHGNYGRYYGYRHADIRGGACDQRLVAVTQRLDKDLFEGKEVNFGKLRSHTAANKHNVRCSSL